MISCPGGAKARKRFSFRSRRAGPREEVECCLCTDVRGSSKEYNVFSKRKEVITVRSCRRKFPFVFYAFVQWDIVHDARKNQSASHARWMDQQSMPPPFLPRHPFLTSGCGQPGCEPSALARSIIRGSGGMQKRGSSGA